MIAGTRRTYLNVVTGVGSSTAATGYDINPFFNGSTGATPVFRFFMRWR